MSKLSELNEASSPMKLNLSVHHQDHSVDAGVVQGLRLSWKSDTGEWQEVPVKARKDGSYAATIKKPKDVPFNEISLRAEA